MRHSQWMNKSKAHHPKNMLFKFLVKRMEWNIHSEQHLLKQYFFIIFHHLPNQIHAPTQTITQTKKRAFPTNNPTPLFFSFKKKRNSLRFPPKKKWVHQSKPSKNSPNSNSPRNSSLRKAARALFTSRTRVPFGITSPHLDLRQGTVAHGWYMPGWVMVGLVYVCVYRWHGAVQKPMVVCFFCWQVCLLAKSVACWGIITVFCVNFRVAHQMKRFSCFSKNIVNRGVFESCPALGPFFVAVLPY